MVAAVSVLEDQDLVCNLDPSGEGRSCTDEVACRTHFAAKVICSLGVALPRLLDRVSSHEVSSLKPWCDTALTAVESSWYA